MRQCTSLQNTRQWIGYDAIHHVVPTVRVAVTIDIAL